MKSRTSIIIAHRLSTIMDADQIFYIQWWEILESGTYNDLMKDKKSKFSQLASSNHLMIN
jgi:ATP-binding cassette subfamily B protein